MKIEKILNEYKAVQRELGLLKEQQNRLKGPAGLVATTPPASAEELPYG